MRFSVLLPTRNRLELLKYAVETVLRQEYGDWELIVSDNFSEQDIAGYVRSLGDSRIKYYRTDSFVSVTDNWNNALDNSSGEYVVMLGDDDCLMPQYFTTMQGLIDEHHRPDVIYTSAFLYAYPGVVPGYPKGYLQLYDGYSAFLPRTTKPFWLDKERALELVRRSMNFELAFGYNMQFSVISRKLIASLRDKGPFFQSPFPDYYATNVLLLKAERLLVYPHPLVTIGISPKSYGFFHFNHREAEGIEFLKSLAAWPSSRRLQPILLPGTNINSSWLFAMEAIKANYGSEFALRANYRRYRLLQIIYVYREYYANRRLSREDVRELERRMHRREKLVYGSILSLLLALMKPIPQRLRGRTLNRLAYGLIKLLGQAPEWGRELHEVQYKNILEVFEQAAPSPARQHGR